MKAFALRVEVSIGLIIIGGLAATPVAAQPADEAPDDPPATEAPADVETPSAGDDEVPVAEPTNTTESNDARADSNVRGDEESSDSPQGEESSDSPQGEESEPHEGHFAFGSYGRIIAAGDGTAGAGREMDIVAYGSRLDLNNYVELELRREDQWRKLGASTRMVATLALGHPIFHYNGDFDAQLAVRNLYLEERDLGLDGLSIWVGSRMLRGDDIYLFDLWPLDNLNTIGGGVRYDVCGQPDSAAATEGQPEAQGKPPKSYPRWCTAVSGHVGIGQPNNPFYEQSAARPSPVNSFGAATIEVLDRQRWVGSFRAEQHVRFGGPGGLKFVAYGEVHGVPEGQRETSQPEVYENMPADGGYVIGAQIGGYTGARARHVNLFVRYARGIAAYGEFAQPTALALDRTTSGAHELMLSLGANWEFGPATIMLGAYLRSFRNANGMLDYGDVDEGIVMIRPHLFIAEWAGFAVEGSYQLQQRGVLVEGLEDGPTGAPNPQPLTAHVGRIGVMPFITLGGRGSYSRPWLYLFYVATVRDRGARMLYPKDDVFHHRDVDHLFGLGAEWWFSSSSYGGL